MNIDVNKAFYFIKNKETTSIRNKNCFWSGSEIPKMTKHFEVISSSFRNSSNYRGVHPESLIVALYCLTGRKYLKKNVCDEIEQKLVAEKV